jgi:hypothetical protein
MYYPGSSDILLLLFGKLVRYVRKVNCMVLDQWFYSFNILEYWA